MDMEEGGKGSMSCHCVKDKYLSVSAWWPSSPVLCMVGYPYRKGDGCGARIGPSAVMQLFFCFAFGILAFWHFGSISVCWMKRMMTIGWCAFIFWIVFTF